MADVRVGIVSWNTRDLLDACLAALPAALSDLDAEVVVVDNASDDDSAAVAAARPGVEVVRNTDNLGYAAGMNRALAGSAAPVLIALNPDTRPPPGSLATLVAALHAWPRAGLVVPRLAHPDGRLQHSVHRFPSPASAAVVCFAPPALRRGRLGRRWWLEGVAPHDRAEPVDWAIGAVHVIRAAAVGAGPVYATRWFMYAEDLELCWRLHRAGWQVWLEPGVEIRHVGNAAGAQAWGGGRAGRYWRASYDFYTLAHGAAATRRWAAVNAPGAALHVLLHVLAACIRRRRRHLLTARGLARLVPVHARAVLRPSDPTAGASPAARSQM